MTDPEPLSDAALDFDFELSILEDDRLRGASMAIMTWEVWDVALSRLRLAEAVCHAVEASREEPGDIWRVGRAMDEWYEGAARAAEEDTRP